VDSGHFTATTTKDLMFPNIAVDAHGSPRIAYLRNDGFISGYFPTVYYNFVGTIYYTKRQNPAGTGTGPTQWSTPAPFLYPELDSMETPPSLVVDFDNTMHMGLVLGDTALYNAGSDTGANWEPMYTYQRKGDAPGFQHSAWFFDLHGAGFPYTDSIGNAIWPMLPLEPSDLGPGLYAGYPNTSTLNWALSGGVVYEGWDPGMITPPSKAAVHTLSLDSLKFSVGKPLKGTFGVHNLTGSVQSYTDSILAYITFPGPVQQKGKFALSSVGANMRKSFYQSLSASLPASSRGRKVTLVSKLYNASWTLVDADTCDFYVRP